ncbi:MAG TPA: hypothetical protein VG844_18350 [Terracidiphilus sp.]|nr:hypothetical protein [Terracidiphilus sp.]
MSESVSQAGITTRLHFSGVTTTYTYDSLNRLLSRATPGEATASFAYTATGQHATMSDASGTTTYTYDTMDCLVTKATPEGTLTYTHSPVASKPPSPLRRADRHYAYDAASNTASVTPTPTAWKRSSLTTR